MTHPYSEDQLIEQTAMDLLESLGWQTANGYAGEAFGPGTTFGRESEREVLLQAAVRRALQSLNPGLPAVAYEQAFELLNAESATKPLEELNREKYGWMRNGIPVTFKNHDGELVRDRKLRLFDFDRPEHNEFLAIRQLWIMGRSRRRRRADIIGFVNGVPLLFMELKAHHRKLKTAYDDNLSDYKDVVPKLFHTNAFIVLSNGLESRIGAITSSFNHFHEWKRIEEDEEGRVSLETIVRGVCQRGRFLDLFENFILYDTSIGQVVKLIARNHQFLGVNKALEQMDRLEERYARGEITLADKQKLGVFWHTQGSGKSYSMVFLCQKIHRKRQGSYTFLLVTDRKELDKQIYGTFAGVGAVNNEKLRAGSGEELQELLRTDSRYIFTLIHKFNFDHKITDRDNIIVISDEAHRTQGGTLALNMRNALPNAALMGFTGTPLFKDDQLTRRLFGDYVSVYDFKRSIEDGATVPLYYENRGEKLELDNPEINQEIREAIEAADLDPDQEDKLKKLFARDYPILTAEKRLRAIAEDVVEHFVGRGYKGKAMFVAIDKVTAVKMYNFITQAWEAYLERWRREIDAMDDLQEQLTARREWEWMRETEIAVVVSSEQNEIRKFQDWGLDIEPHREKMNTRDLEREFKDENHPFRLAIVCAMWITGFDVKSLSTLYLDKPLKSHTLMQTIARANRVHTEEKNNGLIVDYIETYKNLLDALAIYARGGEKGGGEPGDTPVEPKEKLIEALEAAIAETEAFLRDEVGFDLNELLDSRGLDLLVAVDRGVNAVNTTDETRAKFGILAREVFKKFKAVVPDKAIYAFRGRRDAIQSIYRKIEENVEEADITAMVKRIQDVVDAYVNSQSKIGERTPDYGRRIDLSQLDFEVIERYFLKLENKHTAVQSLKQRIESRLNRMVDQNPLRVDFYKTYQEIIEAYNQGKEQVTIEETFSKLVKFIAELSEEEARASREGLREDELAVFDLLRQGKSLSSKEADEVRRIAAGLLEKLRSELFVMDRVMEKVQTAAAVRKAINDYLFEKLPYPTYDQPDIDGKTMVLFDHFRMQLASGVMVA